MIRVELDGALWHRAMFLVPALQPLAMRAIVYTEVFERELALSIVRRSAAGRMTGNPTSAMVKARRVSPVATPLASVPGHTPLALRRYRQ